MFDNYNAAAPANTLIVAAGKIAEYSTTAAALGELHTKYANVIFPVDTPLGMKDAIAARRVLWDLDLGLEKMRKEIKAPALERTRLIDAEAKAISAQLVALKEPIDAQIKRQEAKVAAEKAERERKEAERKAAIQVKIDTIRGIPLAMTGQPAAEFDAEIAELRAFVPGDEFAEFKDDATAAANAAVVALLGMQEKQIAIEAEAARIEAERLADLRAELEAAAQRQRDADAEAARLAKVESDRVAAEVKAQLDAQQASIDAARKQQEADAAAARQAQEAERAAFEAERKAFQEQQAAVAAKAEADRIAALAPAAVEPEPVLQVQEVTADEAREIFVEAAEPEVEPQAAAITPPEVLDFEMAVSALLQTRTPVEVRALLDLALIRFAEELAA